MATETIETTEFFSSTDSDAWDHLLSRSYKADKVRLSLHSLEAERTEQWERILGENLKLSPRYSKEVLNKYHQPTEQPKMEEVTVRSERPASASGIIEFVRTSPTPTITKTRTMPVTLAKSGSHSVTLSFPEELQQSTPNLLVPKIRKSDTKVTTTREVRNSPSPLSGILQTQPFDGKSPLSIQKQKSKS